MSGLASRARDCGPTSRSSYGQESPRGQASGSMSSSSPHWTRTGFWSRMCWISLMDAEHLKRCELLKMSKKIPIAGAPTQSVARNCGKLRVNGCGTCGSHWERCCKEVSFVRWSGPHLPKRLPFSLPGKIPPKSMARGSALERRDERLVDLPQRLLLCKRTASSVAQREPACG